MRKCTLDLRITKLAVIERIDFGIQVLDFCNLLRSKFKISHRETNRIICLSLKFQRGHLNCVFFCKFCLLALHWINNALQIKNLTSIINLFYSIVIFDIENFYFKFALNFVGSWQNKYERKWKRQNKYPQDCRKQQIWFSALENSGPIKLWVKRLALNREMLVHFRVVVHRALGI